MLRPVSGRGANTLDVRRAPLHDERMRLPTIIPATVAALALTACVPTLSPLDVTLDVTGPNGEDCSNGACVTDPPPSTSVPDPVSPDNGASPTDPLPTPPTSEPYDPGNGAPFNG